ncbi:MAG: hypothetical protein JWR70_1041, partial [Modestobacter sp.]|nr:hypothetical protein [Modestobacter sp.]
PQRSREAAPSQDRAPALPLAVQREHLQPPGAPLLSRQQMTDLLGRMIVGGAPLPPSGS